MTNEDATKLVQVVANIYSEAATFVLEECDCYDGKDDERQYWVDALGRLLNLAGRHAREWKIRGWNFDQRLIKCVEDAKNYKEFLKRV